ncbi:(2Fe-2S)-binding protein [Pseudomonas alkylphenolica]|uniref:(2Fe-2S)-binding protein n=1 Tax=Pseudomonas alkylphenolica TaxID=237609 RepID=A0A443ZEK7_9PSED|nr:Rieske 2Fe-2S domain-containing protein [Pseudomonas alkylphenolica]RWU17128.1 (2Fe-2S)-binding protein [Pseudomonas alkylphenolica]
MDRSVALCPLEHLEEGQAIGFDPFNSGHDSVFALMHRGALRVYRNSCPHLDVRLEYRKDRFLSANGQRVICYAHGAQFMPDSGECVFGPCLGQSLTGLAFRCEDGWLRLCIDSLGQPIEVSRSAIGRIRGLD